MSKRFFAAAFAVGLAAVLWVGAGFIGTSWLALAMTAVIGGVFVLGACELQQFRAGTASLAVALDGIPQPLASLADWLQQVPAGLRNAVRLRVEGERGGLPGPALTPYLVGLLVMLGMLGTFLGMVVTFKGAVFALEGSTDLQAIRSALAEPIKGLGLSFGTSVAGVAASAMLGLMSAIARRERMEAGRQLDTRIGTVLLPFSAVHQRHETLHALQLQARAAPELVERLAAMMARMEQRSQQLDEQLLQRQAELQREVTRAYAELAQGVGAALQDSLAAGARAAGESITPVVESAMSRIVQDSGRMHERVGKLAEGQVEAVSQRLDALLASLNGNQERSQQAQAAAEQQRLQRWTEALHQSAGEITRRTSEQAVRTLEGTARLLAETQELVRARTEAEARSIEQHGQRMDQLAGVWRTELAALRQEEGSRGAAAVERLGELQAAVTQHLATLGAALEAPLTRLLQTASEVPQAAAGVITELRQEMSRLAERDNVTLQERTTIVEQLGALLKSLDVQTGQATEMSTHISASAVELSSLGEAFGASMQLFQASSEKLTQALQRIEGSLERSTTRSDEQLAYYVAQAREVIDLSIASQQGIVDHIRQLQVRKDKPIAAVQEARA
ncbi:MAG: hypothetical protein JWP41_4571 [Ramlibacter sp.]|nr:hypothetical protein [Ramlibacter sp.]